MKSRSGGIFNFISNELQLINCQQTWTAPKKEQVTASPEIPPAVRSPIMWLRLSGVNLHGRLPWLRLKHSTSPELGGGACPSQAASPPRAAPNPAASPPRRWW
ncbi:hypothetical protein PVAP13_2NG446103 [Panicum virgatum]|uniref:Uncharacterized protein n=1 Tax=Panicum virgatum TaxID=38727 RepID=A0A8T0VMA4_PANVG|nr:hypothetical protein PVAP13_2NG446103 [Panicum virgatum]